MKKAEMKTMKKAELVKRLWRLEHLFEEAHTLISELEEEYVNIFRFLEQDGYITKEDKEETTN